MTRGPYPTRALEKAQKIAEQRGLVHFYERGPGMIADFSITNPARKAEVKIRRMRRIRCTPQWLEREVSVEIDGLKMFPSSSEISRELWIYSPEYFWRFFSICDTGLVELSRDGSVLPLKSPAPQPKPETGGNGPAAGAPPLSHDISLPGASPSGPTPVPVSGDTSSPSDNTLEKSTDPG
jgi:hypothetical protein